jgi:hypothetical protein
MAYTKQGFYSGQPLEASQLDAMEEGIIEALSNGANLEQGLGVASAQQAQDQDTDKLLEGTPKVPFGYFSYVDKNIPAVELLVKEGQENIDICKWHHREEGSNGSTYATYGGKGNYSIVLGGKALANGKRAFAHGTTTIAWGDYSHAEGDTTIAYGKASHAEGSEAISFGQNSHAAGEKTVAYGQASYAGGVSSEASGKFSFATGWHTKAVHDAQVAFDTWNDPYAPTHKESGGNILLFTIGNGSGENDRRNAFEVYQSGDIGIQYGTKVYSLHAILDTLDRNLGNIIFAEHNELNRN